MRKYYLLRQICSLLLLIFITPCYGQTGGNMFHSAIRDKAGNLWFATTGAGVYRYDAASGVLTNLTERDGLCANNVSCILEDKSGNLWFGERAGGVCLFDTASGRFTKVNGNGCLSSQIMSIIEDKTGNIWFANLYSGVCRYDGKSPPSGQAGFTHWTEDDGLCNDTITCIYEDKKGNLWFGSDFGKVTGRGGICRYDPRMTDGKGKSFTRFTTDGLTNTNVWTIVEDNEGNIWVGTRGGLFRYHSPSGRFINYSHKATGRD